jgi:predicted lipoprotein with Yx(FWY)xxD motif
MAEHTRRPTSSAAILGILAGIALLAAACSSTATSSGPPGSTESAGTSGSSANSATVQTRSTDVGTVLVTSTGMTLYHRTDEANGQVKCTADCATQWPPYTVTAGTTPSAADGVTGLSTIVRPDGTTQVVANGEPLYRYAGDSAPGQTNGEGIEGIWYVVKPGAAAASGSSSSTNSSGYGY